MQQRAPAKWPDSTHCLTVPLCPCLACLLQICLTFLTFWILLSYLVPISLFVTLEIVKFWQVGGRGTRGSRLAVGAKHVLSFARVPALSHFPCAAGRIHTNASQNGQCCCHLLLLTLPARCHPCASAGLCVHQL